MDNYLQAALRALPTKSSARSYPAPDESIETLRDEHRKRRLRVIQQTSPSQIDLFARCERKWAFSYIFGEREPQSAAQAAGTDIDDNYVQPHLRGEVPKTGPWSALLDALARELPEPGTAIVQAELVTPTFDGGPRIIGYPDWMFALDHRTVAVDDLKSTSDFRYIKRREELDDNTQGLSYARSLFQLVEPLEVVRFRHLYALRNERKPQARWSPGPNDNPILWTREDVEERWQKREELVRRMVEGAKGAASGEDLEPNTEACGDYGGCHFRARCGLNLGIFGGMKMSATSTTNGTPTAAPSGNAGLLAKLKARTAAQTGAAPEPAAAKTEPEPDVTVSPFTIVPPDAPSRTSTPEQIEAVDAEVKAKGRAKKEKAAEKAAAPPAEEDPEERAARELLERKAREKAETKKKAEDAVLEAERQRARDDAAAAQKAKMDAASAPLAAALAKPTTHATTRKKPAEAPILFIDCAPTKGATAVELTEWLLDAEEAAAAEYVDAKTGQKGVPDWRMIPYSFDGALASAIRARLDTCPPSLIIRSDSRAAKVALEVLIPHASLVIQGVR